MIIKKNKNKNKIILNYRQLNLVNNNIYIFYYHRILFFIFFLFYFKINFIIKIK